MISLSDFEIGGAVMLFGLLAAPWLVSSHWPDASAVERRRWLFTYRTMFGVAFVGLGLGWLVPALGARGLAAAGIYGVCAIVNTVVRNMSERERSKDADGAG